MSSWLPSRRKEWPFTPSAFEEFLSEPFSGLFSGKGFSPKIDLVEDQEKLTVTAELPGITEKDVEVTLNKGNLVIRGEKKEEREKREGQNSYFLERSYGSFMRQIPLSVEIDEDRINASYKNGILTIELPKSQRERSETKKISIKSN